tara:strand:- start:854 stop:1690 length:837 start_codon:yes stop_codon:yes gene_type:complete
LKIKKTILIEAVKKVIKEQDIDPKQFPLKLSQVAQNPDDAKQDVTKGLSDEDELDDVIKVKPNSMYKVSDLKPSQKSMNIGKAMGMALSMILGKMKTGGDLGAFISNDRHIMDGHHRWVATTMVNPSAKVGGYAVDFPGTDLIRILNAITVGKLGITKGKEGTGGFDQFKEGPIRQELTNLAQKGNKFFKPEEVIEALKKFTGEEGNAAIEAAVKKFTKHLGAVKFVVPQGAPDRVDMPVIDPDKVPGADKMTAKALSRGEVDWNKPQAPFAILPKDK